MSPCTSLSLCQNDRRKLNANREVTSQGPSEFLHSTMRDLCVIKDGNESSGYWNAQNKSASKRRGNKQMEKSWAPRCCWRTCILFPRLSEASQLQLLEHQWDVDNSSVFPGWRDQSSGCRTRPICSTCFPKLIYYPQSNLCLLYPEKNNQEKLITDQNIRAEHNWHPWLVPNLCFSHNVVHSVMIQVSKTWISVNVEIWFK